MKNLNKETTKKVCEKKALFVRKVTTMTAPRGTYTSRLVRKAENGIQYTFDTRKGFDTQNLKPGDHALIAKLRQTHRSHDYVWDVYEIVLPFEILEFNGKKYKRTKTEFGRNTYLIFPKKSQVRS